MGEVLFHADCAGCCGAGRCHFCLRLGEPLARTEGGTWLCLCRPHLRWVHESPEAPVRGRKSPKGLDPVNCAAMLKDTFQIVEVAELPPDAVPQFEQSSDLSRVSARLDPPLCLLSQEEIAR